MCQEYSTLCIHKIIKFEKTIKSHFKIGNWPKVCDRDIYLRKPIESWQNQWEPSTSACGSSTCPQKSPKLVALSCYQSGAGCICWRALNWSGAKSSWGQPEKANIPANLMMRFWLWQATGEQNSRNLTWWYGDEIIVSLQHISGWMGWKAACI